MMNRRIDLEIGDRFVVRNKEHKVDKYVFETKSIIPATHNDMRLFTAFVYEKGNLIEPMIFGWPEIGLLWYAERGELAIKKKK